MDILLSSTIVTNVGKCPLRSIRLCVYICINDIFVNLGFCHFFVIFVLSKIDNIC